MKHKFYTTCTQSKKNPTMQKQYDYFNFNSKKYQPYSYKSIDLH
jgi:hypothetical protein